MKFSNDTVVDILLLLAKEMGTDGVEGITPQFLLALHVLQEIKLNTTFEDRFFAVPLAVGFAGEMCSFRFGFSI